MMLIDTEKLWMKKFAYPVLHYQRGWNDAIQAILENEPTVDAVPVVRCKDCKYLNRKTSVGGFCKCGEVNGGRPFGRVNDDFCSYGKRRANNETD